MKFVRTVYGADTLDENLKFIADALGDFYSDHCIIYQKRPIYGPFDGGKVVREVQTPWKRFDRL